MKKIIFGSFIVGILIAGVSAEALTDIEISGEVDVLGQLTLLPTGEQGNSDFRIPTMLLNFNMPLQEGNLLVVEFEGAEKASDATSTRFEVRTREAYFDLVSIFEGLYALRGGLIPQAWHEAQYEDWEYRFLGETAWVITEKWKYLSYSDLGASFMAELPHNLGEWAVSLTNGEGRDKAEIGPHKEGGVFARFTKAAPWMFSLNYIRGNYDLYGEDVGLKERIQGQVLYRSECWSSGAELLMTQDPADVITANKMAEGVDVLSLAGTSVRGQAASIYLTFHTGDKSEAMFRVDYLNAAVEESGKDLKTLIASWAYQVTDDFRAALAADYTSYGDKYFTFGGRDRSKLEIAAQVLF